MGSLTGNLHSAMAMFYAPTFPAAASSSSAASAPVASSSSSTASNGVAAASTSTTAAEAVHSGLAPAAAAVASHSDSIDSSHCSSNSDAAPSFSQHTPRRLKSQAELAGARYKIITEAHAFPSDTYAVKSQLLLHGVDPKDGLVEVAPRPGAWWHNTTSKNNKTQCRDNRAP